LNVASISRDVPLPWPLAWFQRLADVLVGGCAVVGTVAVALLLGVALGDILGTKLLDRALPSAIEMQETLGAMLIFSGFVLAIRHSAHLSVDIVTGKLSAGAARWCTAFAMAVTCGVFVVLAMQSYALAARSWGVHEVSPGYVSFPIYPFKTLACVACIAGVVESLRKLIWLVTGREAAAPEPRDHQGMVP
jgi:TRAP-type C4-dicarboxylate transport system permease small subunit